MSIGKCRECGTEVSDQAKVCPKCGVSKPIKKTSLFTKIIGVFMVIGLINVITTNMSEQNSSNPSGPPPVDPKAESLKGVSIDKWSWTKGGFDNVMVASFKIKNASSFNVKDITIECVHSSKSGTVIDRNSKIVYERVDAGRSINVNQFNMGFIDIQASSSSCHITDLVVL
jgi:hypothetical protein